jgi:hypothetical protein
METALIALGILGGVAALGVVLRWYWQMYRDFVGPNSRAPAQGKHLAKASTVSGAAAPSRNEARSVHEADGTDTHASTPPTPAIRKGEDGQSRRGSRNDEAWRLGWDHASSAADAECTNAADSNRCASSSPDVEVGVASVLGRSSSTREDPVLPSSPTDRGHHVRTFSDASTVKMSSRGNLSDLADGSGLLPSIGPRTATVRDGAPIQQDSPAESKVACEDADARNNDDDDAHVLERWKKRAARRFNSLAGLTGRPPRRDLSLSPPPPLPLAGDGNHCCAGIMPDPYESTSSIRPQNRHGTDSSDPVSGQQQQQQQQPRRRLGPERWVGRLVDDVGDGVFVLGGRRRFESKADDSRLGIGPPGPEGRADDPRSRRALATRLFPPDDNDGSGISNDDDDEDWSAAGGDDDESGGATDVVAADDPNHDRSGGRLGIGPFRLC